jgi:Prophage antirepressor
LSNLLIKEFNGNQVHTFVWNGKPCWIANEIVSLFDYADASATISQCIQSEKFDPAIEYDVLRGEELKAFKEMVTQVIASTEGDDGVTTNSLVTSLKFVPQLTIFYEDGLYGFLQYTDKPEGIQFRKWVRRDVIPEIRQTGAYVADKVSNKVVSMTEYQKMLIKAKEDAISVQKANMLLKIANGYNGTYRQVLESHATKIITGEHLLPLPVLEQKTYSATEIGEILGITAHKVGVLANKYNLKTEEYGKLFHDKSRYSSKEVETFRYYENVITTLKDLLI